MTGKRLRVRLALLSLCFIFTGIGLAQTRDTIPAFAKKLTSAEWRNIDSDEDQAAVELRPGHRYYLARPRKKAESPGPFDVVRQLPLGWQILALSPQEQNASALAARFSLVLPAGNEWKLSAKLLRRPTFNGEAPIHFLVQVSNTDSFLKALKKLQLEKAVAGQYRSNRSFLLYLSPDEFFDQILPLDQVLFADSREQKAVEERAVNHFDRGVNLVNFLRANAPELNGEGWTVSLKEGRPDSTDIDYRDRYLPSPISASLVTTHASTMATIIAGAGNSSFSGLGVAPMAAISSSSFFDLFPDERTYFDTYGVSTQNHSYGVAIENYYGAEAQAYDQQVYSELPALMHVFSAGNDGTAASESGPYTGVEGFANLTGTFKMAKNVLTVGSVDSFFVVQERSSKGPAYDGRIKPELTALGQDGSSGAAAITSGVVLLLQQAFSQQFATMPSAALLRAILINSADDLGPQGPDFSYGYGNLNAWEAFQTLEQQHFFQGEAAEGERLEYSITVPPGAQNLKVTLAWTDPAAQVNAAQALVNDLDLSLHQAGTGGEWLPWVLSSFPHPDSLTRPASRGKDRLNNQEQITVELPASGTYTIRVEGVTVPQGPQPLAVSYSWQEPGIFRWTYPTAQDPVLAGQQVAIRWKTTFPDAPAEMAFAFLGSDEWTPVNGNTELGPEFTLWNVPDTFARARLRMRSGSTVVFSDTFTISRPLTLSAGFDCQDSTLLLWEAAPGIEAYQLYTFGNNNLNPLQIVRDTFAVVEPAEYFAVAPLVTPEQPGLRSSTIKLEFLNAGCYINTFLADLIDGQAELRLQTGTLFGIESVFFEKWVDGEWVLLEEQLPGQDLLFQTADPDLIQGDNIYRAGIRLSNGKTIYSDTGGVFFVENDNFLLFPNPAFSGDNIIIATGTPVDTDLKLFDAMGRLVFRLPLESQFEIIPTENLPPGIYFFIITKDGKRAKSGKLLLH